ncbi:MAG: hypothetical protein Kow00114_09440 [Kiloniellaceae bacterium]
MTVVARLQQLPVPAATAGALTVAATDQASGSQRVKAVTPVTPVQRHQQRPDGAEAPQGREARRNDPWRDDLQSDDFQAGRRGSAAASQEAASGRLASFSRLSSMPFMVQVLGQQSTAGRSQANLPQTSLSGHRDAALLGSDSYRRAGGEPGFLPHSATFVRLAV